MVASVMADFAICSRKDADNGASSRSIRIACPGLRLEVLVIRAFTQPWPIGAVLATS